MTASLPPLLFSLAPAWLLAAWLVAGCAASREPVRREAAGAAGDFAAGPAEAISAVPLGVEAAREAYRRHELRRHLRFLEAVEPGSLLRAVAAAAPQDRIDAGEVSLPDLYEAGRLLFEHEYSFADGLGSGEARRRFEAGKSPFRRVHEGRFGGPETTTCASCHWRGGPAGAGALVDASFLYGDGDRADGADARNPPSLHGAGVVEALAREMTAELQSIRSALKDEARRQGRALEKGLVAKGIGFGVLRASPDGAIDASGVLGVDPDLVVRPFGWKGTFATIREFVVESLQVHFGIQGEDLIRGHRLHPDPGLAGGGPDPEDPDGDGVPHELTSGQLTALVAYLAMLELPVVRPPETLNDLEPIAKNIPAPTATVFLDGWRRGRELFEEVGCASCHAPVLVLEDPVLRINSRPGGGTLEIDLSRHGERPRLRYDARLGGYPVRLFSDLKRHDLGSRNASRHVDHGVPRSQYLTRRLWGLANSPPYFYDGHAPWFDHAIAAHQGEAAESSKAFLALAPEEKGALRIFLLSLTRERRLIIP